MLLLVLNGCHRNPGPFVGRVGFKYREAKETKVSVSSVKYGYFNVYNSPYFGTIFQGDSVLTQCEYMSSILGGPYKCRILEKK